MIFWGGRSSDSLLWTIHESNGTWIGKTILCSVIGHLAPLELMKGLIERGADPFEKCGDFYPWEFVNLTVTENGKLMFSFQTNSHLPGAAVFAEMMRNGWFEKLESVLKPVNFAL